MVEGYNSGLSVTLATTNQHTYVANSVFWQVDPDEITVESTKAELLATKPLDNNRLKPDEENDTLELKIYNDLNGPIKEVGIKFWNFMRQEYKQLNNQISSRVGIEKIEYSDRYLVTPLTALLIGEIIYGLKAIYDEDNEWPNPEVSIRTTEASNDKNPHRIDHNWRDPHDQEKVLSNFLEQLGLIVNVGLYSRKNVNHRRHLEISWSDNSVTIIVLDQGVGFLEFETPYNFDFNSSPQAQATALLDISKSSTRLGADPAKANYFYISGNKESS